MIDYKFRWINKRDDGTTDAKVTFYEGQIQPVVVYDPVLGKEKVEDGYVRFAILATKIYSFAGTITIEDLRDFFNKELISNPDKKPHPSQAVVKNTDIVALRIQEVD